MRLKRLHPFFCPKNSVNMPCLLRCGGVRTLWGYASVGGDLGGNTRVRKSGGDHRLLFTHQKPTSPRPQNIRKKFNTKLIALTIFTLTLKRLARV